MPTSPTPFPWRPNQRHELIVNVVQFVGAAITKDIPMIIISELHEEVVLSNKAISCRDADPVKRTAATVGAPVTVHQAQQHQLPYSTSIKNALDRFLAQVLVSAQCGGDLWQGSGSTATPSWLLAWQVKRSLWSHKRLRARCTYPW